MNIESLLTRKHEIATGKLCTAPTCPTKPGLSEPPAVVVDLEDILDRETWVTRQSCADGRR
jgi:hypothetical protein